MNSLVKSRVDVFYEGNPWVTILVSNNLPNDH